MHRWWGSSADSEEQAADRASRAARRTIRSLPSDPEDEEEFADCDTSLANASIFQGDGADSDDGSTASDDMAAELARQKALPVEEADFENDEDAWKKEIKDTFEANDVEYWFNVVEARMKKFGINRQWDKKDAIVHLLPADVVEECKPILRLKQADAGPNIYTHVM